VETSLVQAISHVIKSRVPSYQRQFHTQDLILWQTL